MRACSLAVAAPSFDHDLCPGQRVEDLAVQEFVLLTIWHDLSDAKPAKAVDDRASFRRIGGFAAGEPTSERTAFGRGVAPSSRMKDRDAAETDLTPAQLPMKPRSSRTVHALPPRRRRSPERAVKWTSNSGRVFRTRSIDVRSIRLKAVERASASVAFGATTVTLR